MSTKTLQDLLLCGITGDSATTDALNFVVTFYKDDLDNTTLPTQLESLKTLVEARYTDANVVTIPDIVQLLKDMKPSSREMFSQVVTIVRLILVMPATNATSERSFSALRRLKTYLRSTMTQCRLNHLLTLHVHRDATDGMNLTDVANEL